MIRVRLLLASLAALAVMMVLFPAAADAQSMKIGFVKDERFRTDFKAWKTVQDDWEAQQKAWDEEVQTKKKELDSMMTEYEKQRLILSEDKKREREAQMRAKNDDLDAFTRQIFGPNGTAEQKQKQLIEPLLKKISDAIEAVALQENIDVIFTLSSIGYIKDSYDVTDKVLKYLAENE